MQSAAPQGPLVGYRVLDLGVLFAGPLVGSFLADFGADVVKIERPDTGDPVRRFGWRREQDADSVWWKYGGRNKRSVAADLRTIEGQDLVRRLAAVADVLVENFRPGVLERWGLSPDHLSQLNPRLVIARVSGFGQSGPYRDLPGFGSIAEAMTGMAEVNGWPDKPPALPSFALADGLAALTAAFSITSCLLERERSADGRGQVIDVALPEPLLSILGPQVTAYDATGTVVTRTGNRTSHAAPRGAYQCRDGRWVVLTSITQEITARVFEVLGRPELIHDDRFSDNARRIRNADELDEIIAAWIGERSREEVVERFRDAGAAVAPIYTAADVVADPHFVERQTVVRVPDEEMDRGALIPNVIARLSRTPGAMRHAGPPLDSGRGSVLRDWLGEE
jgi:crotonobetainyl-CoA:carnitine CoA-transferase CaiB-like acyl-CoA transferase